MQPSMRYGSVVESPLSLSSTLAVTPVIANAETDVMIERLPYYNLPTVTLSCLILP